MTQQLHTNATTKKRGERKRGTMMNEVLTSKTVVFKI